MRRPLVVLAAVLLFCGCQGTSPGSAPVDPFFGRTRIEPPRTGSVAAPRAYDPYYSGTRQASIPQKPALPQSGGVPRPPASGGAWQASGASQPSSSGGLRLQNVSQPPLDQSSSPAAAQRQGDLVLVPLNARQSTTTSALAERQTAPTSRTASTNNSVVPATRAQGTTAQESTTSTYDAARRLASSIYDQGAAAALAGRERIIGVIEPRGKEVSSLNSGSQAVGGGTGATQPRKLTLPGTNPVNITDLPPPNRSSAVERAAGDTGASGVRLASAIEELPATEPALRARYGYDPEYRWLIGRLEYSQVDRRWKLRYIPIDGTTDDFGGSVVLTDTPLLSGYERGDFVEVHGRLLKPESTGKVFSPSYEIREIKRLGK